MCFDSLEDGEEFYNKYVKKKGSWCKNTAWYSKRGKKKRSIKLGFQLSGYGLPKLDNSSLATSWTDNLFPGY